VLFLVLLQERFILSVLRVEFSFVVIHGNCSILLFLVLLELSLHDLLMMVVELLESDRKLFLVERDLAV